MNKPSAAPLDVFAPWTRRTDRLPPHAFLAVGAVSRYLGPSFAVLLFAHVQPLGVAWLRIASAGLVFAAWGRPWRYWATLTTTDRRSVVALGAVLAVMNATFYLAIQRLPLGTVGAIEFLGPVLIAAGGIRSRRNVGALVLAVMGVAVLTHVRWAGEPVGYLLAFANCALFMLYIVLGHRIARTGGAHGVERLGVAMLIAGLVAFPLGIRQALPALSSPMLLLAALAVGICSSVIPYVADQLALARLPRSTFALLLSLLPAVATVIGFIVLAQVPTPAEALGVALVIAGVALHQAKPK